MSIRGRYIIDRLKHTTLFSQYLQLPVPPYENPNYWENIYKTLGSNDTYEWGNIQYNDLIQYQYEHYYQNNDHNNNNNDTTSHTTTTTNPMIKWLLSSNILQYSDSSSSSTGNEPKKKTMTTTFHETMGLKNPQNNKILNNDGQQQVHNNNNNNNMDPSLRRKYEMELQLKQQKDKEEPILILGCGNSQFGENMMEHQQQSNDNNDTLLYVGPIIQMDVSSRVIDSMSYRCNKFIETGDMILIQDDATILSSLNDNTIQCTFDKGLIDALYCSNDYLQCYQIMNTVHRVLKTNSTNNNNHSDGIFSFLSFSNPEFLLNKLLIPPSSSISTNDIQYYKYQQQIVSKQQQHKILNMWSNIQIRKLASIYLYRFTKCNRDNNQQQQRHQYQSTNMLHPSSRIKPSSISVGKKRQKR